MRSLSYFSAVTYFGAATAFAPQGTTLKETTLFSSVPSDVSSASLSLTDLKADLVRACTKEEKPPMSTIQTLVRDLEDKAEMVGEGQSSSTTGLMAGEWYV